MPANRGSGGQAILATPVMLSLPLTCCSTAPSKQHRYAGLSTGHLFIYSLIILPSFCLMVSVGQLGPVSNAFRVKAGNRAWKNSQGTHTIHSHSHAEGQVRAPIKLGTHVFGLWGETHANTGRTCKLSKCHWDSNQEPL